MTDESAAPPTVRRAHLGLSGKLLLLTTLFVMIAEVLIYVPLVANYRVSWLMDHLEVARTAALVLEAAPNGMVPDPLAKRILDSIGARAVAMKMGETHYMLQPSDVTLPPIADVFDMRNVGTVESIVDAFKLMLNDKKEVMRVVGPAPMGGEYIDLVMDEQTLREAMLHYSAGILLVSLLISAFTAALVYLALNHMFVRPMRRVTENMMAFRADPENPDRVIVPSGRADEIGFAERELAAMQTELASMLHQKNRLAALGLAVSKINHDLRNLLASAQLFSDRLAKLPDPGVQRFAPKLMQALERAIAFCQSTLSYGRLQEPPPDRRQILLEPLVEEVHETLNLGGGRSDPVDQRGRARPHRGGRLRPVVPHPAQSGPQRRSGDGKPRGARSRQRPDSHYRAARGCGGGDRGLRYRPRLFRKSARPFVRGVPGFDAHRRHRIRTRYRRRTGARPWRRNPAGRGDHRGDTAADDSGPRG